VSIAGTFNNWDPQAHPLRMGRIMACLPPRSICPRPAEYKFVINGNGAKIVLRRIRAESIWYEEQLLCV